MAGFLRPMSVDFTWRTAATASAFMAAAVAARAALDMVLPNAPPFITLYPAVALAGLLCGPLAAGIAGLLGVLAAVYLWIPPRMSFRLPNLTDCVSLALFVAASSIILVVAATLRARLREASLAKDALDLGLEAGGVGTWDINLRTREITASAAAHLLHALPETARTNAEDWLRGVHPDDVAAITEALQAAVATGGQASYTYRLIGQAGFPRWIAARGKVVASGGDRHLLCALVDITEQARVQDELRREREQLRLALSAGALAVWDYDIASGEATIDTRYAATMGFTPGTATLTRDQIGARMHPDDRARVAAEHAAFIARGYDYRIEYRVLTQSGGERWLLSQGMMIRDGMREPSRMVGIMQDITGRKQREADLLDLAAARELLVREADHRIKNSLQLVISLLTEQMRGVAEPAATDALRGAITRVGAIAASHLALQGSDDLTEVDLAVTLRDLCGHFAQLHPKVTIEYRPRAALMLDADRAIPLGLAVSEVLTNALRHAFPDRQAGKVEVTAGIERSYLLVRISDNGIGMPPDTGAAGLGSRIIRSLTAQLGASLDVDSTPQAGTVVTLRMPSMQQQAGQRAAD